MLVEGKVGPVSAADQTMNEFRQDRTTALVTTDAHGKYQEAVIRGGMYIGANPAGTSVTTQAGLSATTPALTLYNPVNSGVNLVLLTCTTAVTASPAAAVAFMLAFNVATAAAPSSTTAATLQNAFLSSAATGRGQCYRVATLAAAPVAIRYMWGATGASAISGVPYVDHIDGEIIVPPGVALSVQTTSAAAALCSFTWEEVTV